MIYYGKSLIFITLKALITSRNFASICQISAIEYITFIIVHVVMDRILYLHVNVHTILDKLWDVIHIERKSQRKIALYVNNTKLS